MQKIFSIFLAFILAFGLVTMPVLVKPALAAPGTIYVSVSGDDSLGNGTAENPYRTITKGISSASTDDTISVAAGTYDEKITLPKTKAVTIEGTQGAHDTIIDGGNSGMVITAIDANPGIKLDGFTIRNGSTSFPPDLGAGIFINGCSPTITNCIITNNTGSFGGGIYITASLSQPVISNCWIKYNTATSGGGIMVANSASPDIINCTIVDNTASDGGGIYHSNSSSDITNSIVYSNGASNIVGSPNVNYSCIEGGGTSGTNIDADPLFNTSYPSTPYHLKSDSPCIDTGDNTTWGEDDLDIDGNLRSYKGKVAHVVDMGVSEYLSEPPAPDDTQPPEASNPNPPDGGYTANSTPDISVNLTDNSGVDPTGVDPDSIDLWVAGANVTPDITWTDPVVYYTPSASFANGQVVDVSVDASDNAGNAMTTPYSWSFTISPEYSLTFDVIPPGSGTVNATPSGPYYYNDTVIIKAVANAGWSFADWSGDLDGSTNPATIIMDGNKTVTATFTQDEYSLTVSASPSEGGSVSVDQPGPYYSGDTVTLTASANPGYTFANWSGDLTGSTSPATIIMDGNKSVTATFTQEATQDAYSVKLTTITKLGSGKTGDKKIDKKIDKAIKHLDKSLAEKLWVDDTHLDEKHGAKVFNEEKKTVKELMHLLDKDKTPEDFKDICQSVIDELVQADNLLANTAYNEAEAYAGDSKVDKELKKCDKEFEKAQKELDHTKKDGSPDPKYDKAIGHYKNAWKHAQKALRKAT